MIILMAGLPGTGKTTLARHLAERTGGTVLGKDEIRASIFAPAQIEYSTVQDDGVMAVMIQAARVLLTKEPALHVFFDGRTFSRHYQIERVLAAARELGQPSRIIECICSDESARRRLEDQPDPGHPAQNRTFALHQEVKGYFEPITYPKTTICTDEAVEVCVQRALSALG
jgi:predicted kinase